MINVFIWLAQAYLDMTEMEIQSLYGYPVLIITLFLPLETIAVTAIPLVFAPILYFQGVLSKDNTTLLVLYIFSTAPYIQISIPLLIITAGPYIYAVKRFTGLEEEIATAPAGTASVILTYAIALTIL
ncbi:MAG: hypothetical protein ABEK04_01170 [Candidatus Nanohalobium sp.]